MSTQCPNCHARAKLPDDHAGAKVRCAECGRVFVARADGAGGKMRRNAFGSFLGLLGGVVFLILLAGSLAFFFGIFTLGSTNFD